MLLIFYLFYFLILQQLYGTHNFCLNICFKAWKERTGMDSSPVCSSPWAVLYLKRELLSFLRVGWKCRWLQCRTVHFWITVSCYGHVAEIIFEKQSYVFKCFSHRVILFLFFFFVNKRSVWSIYNYMKYITSCMRWNFWCLNRDFENQR